MHPNSLHFIKCALWPFCQVLHPYYLLVTYKLRTQNLKLGFLFYLNVNGRRSVLSLSTSFEFRVQENYLELCWTRNSDWVRVHFFDPFTLGRKGNSSSKYWAPISCVTNGEWMENLTKGPKYMFDKMQGIRMHIFKM